MDEIKLYLFDLDGTLAVKWKPDLLPGRVDALETLAVPAAIVTNQGGVHAGYHWRQQGRDEHAAKYPTPETILERLDSVTREMPAIERAYVALHVGHDEYVLPDPARDIKTTLSTGVPVHMAWDPAWRKPAGGMLRQACCDFGVPLQAAVMLGDKDYDEGAARNADNMRFIYVADETWDRETFN